MAKKLTIEEVRSRVEAAGYKLLSNNYENRSTKLTVQCPDLHVYPVMYSRFQQGDRCFICSTKTKISIEQVRAELEALGFTLASSSFKSVEQKLVVKCVEGHVFQRSLYNIRKRSTCPVCSKAQRSKKHEDLSKYIPEVEILGFKVLELKRKNDHIHCYVECASGHRFWRTRNSFSKSKNCLECQKSDYLESLRRFVQSVNCELISLSQVNGISHIAVTCSNKHVIVREVTNFKKHSGCLECQDFERYQLGSLCERRHEWLDTGQSIVFPVTGVCVKCAREDGVGLTEYRKSYYLANIERKRFLRSSYYVNNREKLLKQGRLVLILGRSNPSNDWNTYPPIEHRANFDTSCMTQNSGIWLYVFSVFPNKFNISFHR